MLANTRCHSVAVLDISAISPVADFFVIATGTSARQMRSACEDTEELGKSINMRACWRCGYEGQSWMLADFIDVVVHVFSEEARQFYDLEGLWGDGQKVQWEAGK